MKRTFGMMAAAAALFVAAGAYADEAAKKIMKECNGAGGLSSTTEKFVKAKNWEKATDAAKGLKESAAKLADAKPKKGSDESWKEQTKKFADYGEAVFTAVEGKDAGKATKALAAFKGSCKECHSAHK